MGSFQGREFGIEWCEDGREVGLRYIFEVLKSALFAFVYAPECFGCLSFEVF